MIDWDEWAKEDCACGHRRYAHKSGGCTGTVTGQINYNLLPAPVYETDDFAEWPTNWPPRDQVVETESPCPCRGFREPEPSEPPHA